MESRAGRPGIRPRCGSAVRPVESEEEKTDPCASCGKPGVNRFKNEVDDVPLCGACSDRLLSGEAVAYFVPTEVEPPPPPKERFGALFEAARVLLEQGGAEEDQIIPTLAFANEIGQGLVSLLSIRRQLVEASGGAEKWERASDEFVSRYGSLRPVRVADGTHGGPPARRGGTRHAGIKAGGWWRRVRPSYCGEVDYASVLREAHGELPIRDEDLQRYWDEDKITVRYPGEASRQPDLGSPEPEDCSSVRQTRRAGPRGHNCSEGAF
jgi:hypothetical protein